MKLLLSLLALVAGGALAADGTLAALDRPAERARAPERAVLLSAAAADAHWVAVGERGLVLRSDDNGKTWQQSPAPVSVTLTAVRFADARHGIAVGHGGTVLVTEDGGQTWTRRLDGRQLAAQLLAVAKASGNALSLIHISEPTRPY